MGTIPSVGSGVEILQLKGSRGFLLKLLRHKGSGNGTQPPCCGDGRPPRAGPGVHILSWDTEPPATGRARLAGGGSLNTELTWCDGLSTALHALGCSYLGLGVMSYKQACLEG